MSFRPTFICQQCSNLSECKGNCKKGERTAPRRYDDCLYYSSSNVKERVSALSGVDFRISS